MITCGNRVDTKNNRVESWRSLKGILMSKSPSCVVISMWKVVRIVLPVPYAKKYTSVKRAADWVIVSANTLGMLRLTIKTLLNQSRDISTS